MHGEYIVQLVDVHRMPFERAVQEINHFIKDLQDTVESMRDVLKDAEGCHPPVVSIYSYKDTMCIDLSADKIMTQEERTQHNARSAFVQLNEEERTAFVKIYDEIDACHITRKLESEREVIQRNLDQSVEVIKGWPEWKRNALLEALK